MPKPVYKNLQQPAPDDPVMRYTSLAGLVSILTRKELPLIRLDIFRDPFEGSIPQSVVDQRLLIQAGVNAEQMEKAMRPHPIRQIQVATMGRKLPHWMEMTQDVHEKLAWRVKARIKSTYASCWRVGPESEGMWRLYCGEKDGVVLKTTFSRLEHSIGNSDVIAGKIQYGDYKKIPAFDDELDHVMWKREGFRSESELRLLMTDGEVYEQLLGNQAVPLTESIHIPWNVNATVEQILVSPYASEWYFEAVRSAVGHIDNQGLAERVVWSELKQEPVF